MQARRKRKQRGRGLTPGEAAILKRRFKQVSQGFKKCQRAKQTFIRQVGENPTFDLMGPLIIAASRRRR